MKAAFRNVSKSEHFRAKSFNSAGACAFPYRNDNCNICAVSVKRRMNFWRNSVRNKTIVGQRSDLVL